MKNLYALLAWYNNLDVAPGLEWLAHIAISWDVYIQHVWNSNETALGMKKLRIDGWCEETQTAFEYDGCYYHGHTCVTKWANLPAVAELTERVEKTKAKHAYICDVLGITLEVMQECTWNQERKAKNIPPRVNYNLTEMKILEGVKDGSLFGCVLCDIRVPNNPAARKKFAEMTPIFKNCEISHNDIGPYMWQVGENTTC